MGMKKKQRFNAVKHVKRLSRAVLKVPQGKIIRPKRKKLIEKVIDRESRTLAQDV
jgi:hypothetical protein